MKSMLQGFYRFLLKGLAVVLPVLVTAYILYWVASTLESLFGNAIKLVLPDRYYYPGIGLGVAFVAVGFIGFLFQALLVRKLWQWIERGLCGIPLVSSIYGAIRDFMDFMDRSAAKDARKVVMVKWPDTSMKLVGFVTREDFEGLPDGIGGEGVVAVYVPMSYQIGGFTVMMPRERVELVDLTIEEAMRFALTGAMTLKKRQIQDRPST